MAELEWPTCVKCGEGQLVPLSDFGPDGASVTYKAWACTNPACGFLMKIQKGDAAYGKVAEAR